MVSVDVEARNSTGYWHESQDHVRGRRARGKEFLLPLPIFAFLTLSSSSSGERIPIDSVLIFPFAGSVLVYGHKQLLL